MSSQDKENVRSQLEDYEERRVSSIKICMLLRNYRFWFSEEMVSRYREDSVCP